MQLFSMSLNLGYEGESQCVFCRRFTESRDCLFFESSFPKRLVFNIIAEVFLEESYLAMGCEFLKRKKYDISNLEGGLGCFVFHVCMMQRNAQIYKDVIRTEEIVLQAIKWGVKTRVECGKKIKSKFGVACGGFPVHF